MFYRDLQQQNRKITRTQSIKVSYSDFAETMIAKLKSYNHQCKIFLNQSLKGLLNFKFRKEIVEKNFNIIFFKFLFYLEFRDCLVRYETLCSRMPEIIIKELFEQFSHLIENKFVELNQVNEKKLDQFEKERVSCL
jgi:hypothetical protein